MPRRMEGAVQKNGRESDLPAVRCAMSVDQNWKRSPTLTVRNPRLAIKVRIFRKFAFVKSVTGVPHIRQRLDWHSSQDRDVPDLRICKTDVLERASPQDGKVGEFCVRNVELFETRAGS